MRSSRLLGTIGGLAILALAMPSSPASATAVHFFGSAPGSVTCQVSVTVRFSPALTDTGGGVRRQAQGKVSSCVASDSRVTITAGKFKTTDPLLTSTGLNCGSPAGSAGSFSIYWKGQFNGALTPGGPSFVKAASYLPSDVVASGTQVVTDGSQHLGLAFAQPVSVFQSFSSAGPAGVSGSLFSTMTAAQRDALCGPGGRGLKSVTLNGALTVG